MSRKYTGRPRQIQRILSAAGDEFLRLRDAGAHVEMSCRIGVGFDLDAASSLKLGGDAGAPDLEQMVRGAIQSAARVEGGVQRLRRLLADGELELEIKATGVPEASG